MSRRSAGILLYCFRNSGLEVFLVHPGGPFWAKKDLGAWSIPKGEIDDNEEPLTAALREFREETGHDLTGLPQLLMPLKQPSGKVVHAWAMAGDLAPAEVRSNTFSIELPRGSGRQVEFPEIDRAAWFDLDEARRRILPGQAPFLAELARLVP